MRWAKVTLRCYIYKGLCHTFFPFFSVPSVCERKRERKKGDSSPDSYNIHKTQIGGEGGGGKKKKHIKDLDHIVLRATCFLSLTAPYALSMDAKGTRTRCNKRSVCIPRFFLPFFFLFQNRDANYGLIFLFFFNQCVTWIMKYTKCVLLY